MLEIFLSKAVKAEEDHIAETGCRAFKLLGGAAVFAAPLSSGLMRDSGQSRLELVSEVLKLERLTQVTGSN